VIEDAAQSFGATRNGVKSCGASLIGSTSFFPAKPLGCYGDGGALFTDDDKLAETIRAIRTHGGLNGIITRMWEPTDGLTPCRQP
jgi:UDP-2-acetamido-2-deoxy-ribo-hexuluronate aminotransferase